LLYRAEFTNDLSSDQLAIIFPCPPQALDAQGRPLLKYFPIFDKDSKTNVVIINNTPQFTAIQIPPATPHPLSDIPGVVTNKTGSHFNGWFTFDHPPTNYPCWKMGPYFIDHFPCFVWITNRENFFKFTLLALGGTNAYVPGQSSQAPFTIQNGIAVPSFQFR
jgi:hypothetical protein